MKQLSNLSPVVLFTIFLLFTSNHFLYSQGNSNGNANSNNNANGNALKWETQGNNADTTDFIGTTNPTALKMRTNNVERFRITKDGKLGIGISNPLEKFELQGNLKLTGDVIFSDYADVNNPEDKILFVDENGRTQTKDQKTLKSLMYNSDCVALPDPSDPVLGTLSTTDTLGVTLPTWANTINGTKNILYTGTGCPSWVGIGTDEPIEKLDVRGRIRATQNIFLGIPLNTPNNQFSNLARLRIINAQPLAQNNKGDFIRFDDYSASYDGNKLKTLFKVNDKGGIEIDYLGQDLALDIHSISEDRELLQLENNGLLRARRIKIDQLNWADNVFEKDYKLMPLNELQYFIQTNGHLPEVPTTEEVKEKGVDLAETNVLLLKKIEELTLYLLEQKEETDALRKELEELKALVNQ